MTKRKLIRVAAYGVVVINESLLLCRMARDAPSAGMWTLPGGGIEFGEAPWDAVVREFAEETGLTIKPLHVLTVLSDINEVDEIVEHSVRIVYRVALLGGNLTSERCGSTDLCAWHTREGMRILDLVPMARLAGELAFPVGAE
jgi:ADP-ribose pyrophosphatase YjhB (NUDIX family)